jgi:hypothetical protein
MAERIDWLAEQPQVISAARVAYTFGLDPVTLLRDGGDTLLTLIRAAALRIVQADERRAARK